MAHRFDSGLGLSQRAAIRRAVVAAIEELRLPVSPGGGALYLQAVVELATPVRFTQDYDEEHFRLVVAGRSPAVAVALGDRTFSSYGSDNEEWKGALDVHVYSSSANARGAFARVAGDVASEVSITADPGVEVIAEHIFERLSGAPLAGLHVGEVRPVREGIVLLAEDATVFEQVFSVEVLTPVNPRRALIVKATSIDTSHTDHDNPLTAGSDADPATGPAPRPLTAIEES